MKKLEGARALLCCEVRRPALKERSPPAVGQGVDLVVFKDFVVVVAAHIYTTNVKKKKTP